MFKSGDLIKYVGGNSRYRVGRPFTIVEKYSYRDNTFSCIRSGMVYYRQFKEEEMELLESIPKFSLGDAVEISSRDTYSMSLVGVIMASNSAGSIVRLADEFHHWVEYKPNSKLKRIK